LTSQIIGIFCCIGVWYYVTRSSDLMHFGATSWIAQWEFCGKRATPMTASVQKMI